MSKIPLKILLADIHLSLENIHKKKALIKQVIDVAKKKNCKCIVLMGDIFDSRKGQPERVLNAFGDILTMLSEWFEEIILIPGNHDKENYENGQNSTRKRMRKYISGLEQLLS